MGWQFKTRMSRLVLVLVTAWVIGWTVFANLTFETVCPLENGSAFDCALEGVDQVWSERSWLIYLSVLAAPILISIGVGWALRDSK